MAAGSSYFSVSRKESIFQSVADRDGMMQSGMEEGVNDSYDRLDELLEKMKQGSTK